MSDIYRVRPKRDGYVYFAQADSRGISPIKIGWSTNPWSQVHEAHRWLWFQIEVVGYISVPRGSSYWGPGFGSLEKTLHGLFASERLKREWFRAHPILVELANRAEDGISIQEAFTCLSPYLPEDYVAKHMRRLG